LSYESILWPVYVPTWIIATLYPRFHRTLISDAGVCRPLPLLTILHLGCC
jgi:hypothetical protein